MTDKQELYTDYAMQIFSSYISHDTDSMQMILESFKNDGKVDDTMFMPGLIYGFIYHLMNIFTFLAEQSDKTLEEVTASYAMDYAIMREDLLDNPLLNVHKAREVFEQLIATSEEIQNYLNRFDN